MSATFQIQSQGFSATQQQLLQLAEPDFQQELLENIGAIVESQTRQRIQEDKAGPDGKVWTEWLERYSRARNGGQSLLQSKGALKGSGQGFMIFRPLPGFRFLRKVIHNFRF